MSAHLCDTCGFHHSAPHPFNALRTIVFAVTFGIVEVLAALRLDGILSALLWAIAAWNVVLLTFLLIGLSTFAARHMTEEATR